MDNDMPRKGIQDLRDEIVNELKNAEYPFADADNFLIENVITLLQRAGKILWKPLPQPRVMGFTSRLLRQMADQVDAYQMLMNAGADLARISASIEVDGEIFGRLWWSNAGPFLLVDTNALELSWMSRDTFFRCFPPLMALEVDE